MKFPYHKMTSIAAVVVMAATAFVGSARDDWSRQARQRKADFLFMEAQRQKALDNVDGYFELYRQAYELDTTSAALGQDLGYYYMALAGNDSVFGYTGYRMMRRYFDANPGDYYASIFYGQVSDHVRDRGEALRVWATLDSIYPDKVDVAMKYAEALGASGDTVSARKSLAVLDRVERSTGKDLGVSSQRVRTLFALRDTAAILSELDQLLESAPRSASVRVYAGDVYTALGRPDSAITYYDQACAVDSTNGLAYYRRADFYRQQGDSVAFDREVFRALRQSTLDIDVKNEILTNYVRELYQDSLQRPRINELFETLISQHPHEVMVRETYAAYLAVIDNYAAAAEQVDYALDVDPSNPDQWRTAIAFHLNADDYRAALDDGRKALRYHPDNTAIMLMNATSLIQLDSVNEAIPVIRRAIELTDSLDLETRSQITTVLGDAFYKLGQRDSAFACYDEALTLDPGNLIAMNNCAYHLAVEGLDLDRAEKLSATTIREQPQNATSLDTYAWVMFKKKDYVMAKDYINRALEYEEEPSAELYEHAGDIYFMDGRPDEALEYWEKALDLDPDNELLSRKVKHKTYFYK